MPNDRGHYYFNNGLSCLFEMLTSDARRLVPLHLQPVEVQHQRSVLSVTVFDFYEGDGGVFQELVLSVLVPVDKEREASESILRETPTLGIRTRLVDRYVADRKMVTIETVFGSVTVKVKLLEGKAISASPEPDEVRRIALESGTPFQEVYQMATEQARRQLF